MFSLGRPCNQLKIQWIKSFRRLADGKSFSTGAILEYCKYQRGIACKPLPLHPGSAPPPSLTGC